MFRKRNKPQVGFLEESRYELAHADELLLKRTFEVGVIHGSKEMIEKACEFVERKGLNSYWLRKYLEGEIPIDYDGIDKAMEESPCDSCPTNEDYLNGGECYCSKVEE